MSLDDQNLECPLCMEPFEMDDFNFFPCTCGYQICRFCWHRIRTDENGLCPACRKQYPEDPADFKPLSAEELQKIKSEKRQKDQQRKQKMSECRKHLANVRVVQKNLVFVVGLPARLADAEGLKKHDYFGKFGKIHKVVVNQSTSYAGSQGPSASAYVTYCRQDDALRAIKSVNNIQVDGRTLKASLGTTKYCSHFLKNQQCPKADCMYLHELGDEAASFTKEDMQQGKHQEYEKKLQDQIIGCNRKQSASPTPQQNSSDTNQETWPCTVQSIKELGPCRSKDSTQGQKTDKSSRSKNKHCFSEGQKSKKSKNRNSESSHSSVNVSKISDVKDDSFVPRKSQKQQKHSKDMSSQPSGQIPIQRVDGLSSVLNVPGIIATNKSPEVTELNNNNSQTTFVQISEKSLSNHSSENIKITRSESPSLPPSPTSSSSSSLFTPFGSLSSNFLSSSSPSPPPSNASQSFGILGNSSRMQGADSPTNTYAAPAVAEPIKRQSSSQLFENSENSDSLFSHMINLPISSNCGSYNGHVPATDEMPPTDSLDWNSSYPFDSQKQLEDDLDFDPWDESSKGLADLMATEASHNVSYTTTSMPPGFSQPMNAPMPNSQRISIPPPGFGSKQQVQHTGALNNIPNSYGINSEFNSKLFVNEKRQTLIQKLPHLQSPPQNHSNHSKQPQHHYSRDFSSRVNDILRIKNFQEGFRALFPNINVSFGSHNNPKNYTQNGQAGNYPAGRDLSWLYNDSTVLNSGNITEAQRSNAPYLMKALQQLKIEDTLGPFNGHSSYSAPFALRGQWPSSTQCPPPGFVAPSRSPANNTPFQHMQVNQKI